MWTGNQIPGTRNPYDNQTRTGIPARGNGPFPERRVQAGSREIRQVPGGDRHQRSRSIPRPTSVYVTHEPTRPRFYVNGPRGYKGSTAAIIAGIALAVLGFCIAPVDPVGGVLFAVTGVALAAFGMLSRSHGDGVQCN